MHTILKLSLFAFVISTSLIAYSENVVITSPYQKTTIVFKIDTQKDNAPFYSVINRGKVILTESPLGLDFENQRTLQSNLQITSTKVKITKQLVTSATKLQLQLKAKNGVAIILTKK